MASSSEGRHTHSQGERTIKEIYKTGHCKIIYNLYDRSVQVYLQFTRQVYLAKRFEAFSKFQVKDLVQFEQCVDVSNKSFVLIEILDHFGF